MDKFICTVACSPLRAEPDHKREMVSQLLYGERVVVLDQSNKDWIRVRCAEDGYVGWCQRSHCECIDQKKADKLTLRLNPYYIGELSGPGHKIKIPLGSILLLNKRGDIVGKEKLRFKGNPWNPLKATHKKAEIKGLALKFLDAPYLWGGKTVFGTDCSGFTQTLFRFLHVSLMRDAWQQATQGELVDSLEKSKCGDLAFFDNAQGKITHVGLMLDAYEIIHASGKVRIDKIDEFGIINRENSHRSHQLQRIRRYF